MISPRGILFDYGSTLLVAPAFDARAGFGRVFEEVRIPRGQNRDEIICFAVALETELFEARDTPIFEHPFVFLLKIIFDLYSIETDVDPARLEAIYYCAAVNFSPADNVERFLARAEQARRKMGVVSNSTHSSVTLERELARHGLSRYFDFVISSADYGIKKQHHLLFDIARTKLGFDRDEVVFIGDNLIYDVQSAQNAGITAIWYNRHGLTPDGVQPDYTITDWSDVQLFDFNA